MSALRSFIIRTASRIAGDSGWLAEFINGFAINGLVNAGRNRPHPWSTYSDYISWSGLTDRTYSARMLPEALNPQPLPPVEDIVQLFVPESGGQRLCPKCERASRRDQQAPGADRVSSDRRYRDVTQSRRRRR